MSQSTCCRDSADGTKGASTCCRDAVECVPRLSCPAQESEIASLSNAELLMRFRRGVENFDRRLFWLSEEQLDQAFLPDANVGTWPVRVLLGHLADADLAAIHRMRRAVAEENPVFAEWDENAFVDQNLYGVGRGVSGGGAVGAFVAVVHTLRQWTAMWLMGLTDTQLARTGLHPTRGAMSVRDIVVKYTWHLEHHAAFLNEKLARFLGEPTPEDHADASGCCGGPSKSDACGCKH